jgi:DNA oxidative demethylase
MATVSATRAKRSLAAPDGLLYLAGFVSVEEEEQLLAELAPLTYREIQMHGVIARRTVLHYGVDYGYESWKLTPAPDPPAFLLPLRARSAALIGVAPEELAEVLLTRYPPGAGIGWHRDAPMFGPAVVGISLAGPARMRLRRAVDGGHEAWDLALGPRSAYVLQGEARRVWQHMLPGVKALRYSITFRTVRGR